MSRPPSGLLDHQLPWTELSSQPSGGACCTLSWSLADRGARERLRQHLLLCGALNNPAIPIPFALVSGLDELSYVEHWSNGPVPPRLDQRAKGAASAQEVLSLATALGPVLLHLERCGVVHGQIAPWTVAWQAEAHAVWLFDFSRGCFVHAPPGRVLRHAPTAHDDLRSLGRLLLWLATGQDDVAQAAPDAEHTLGMVGIDVLASLDPFLMHVVRGLLRSGGPAGFRSAQALCDTLAQRGATGQGWGRAASWRLPVERFGRTEELEALLQAFAAVDGRTAGPSDTPASGPRPALVVVDGISGVGKTSVAQAACRTMSRHGARVAEGKFNQYGNRQPLSALIDALDHALADAAELGGHQQQDVAARVRDSLGALASALAPSLPWLERLIGPLPQAPALTGEASRTRFELALRRLVVAMSAQDAPLVLFVDDLQWADQRSLELLAGLLVEPRMSSLLVVAAYRSEAVQDGHPLQAWLNRMRADLQVDLRQVTVQAWTAADIEQLLDAAEVHAGHARSQAAAALAHFGAGNPFATLQALRSAEHAGAVVPNEAGGGWTVDASLLAACLQGQTTIRLVQTQLRRLPEDCLQTLCDAAHLGAAWSLDTLGAARGRPALQVCKDLGPALAAGLLLAVDDEAAPGQALTLRFLHDQVQQAAHDLVDDTARDEVRLRLGRGLLQHSLTHGHLDQFLFAIVQQFNGLEAGASRRLDSETAVQLNERAGQLARAQGASAESLAYFLKAVQACSPSTWAHAPRQAFVLYRQAAEAAYLAARFEVVDELLDLAAAHGPDLLESAQFGELRVLVLLARNRLAQALQTGQATLDTLGVPLLPVGDPSAWPQVPKASDMDLREPSPPVVDSALRLLVGLTPCAFITSFEMYARVIRTMIELARQWPASPLTPLAWTNYGLTLCGMERRAEAFDASELALSLLPTVDDQALRCKVKVLCQGFLRHWRLPVAQVLHPLLQAYEDCLVFGDREYLGYAAFLYCDKAFGTVALDELAAGHALRTTTVGQFGHDFSHQHCLVWLQGLQSLRGGLRASPLQLDGASFAEGQGLVRLEQANNGFSLFTAHTLRAALAWQRGDVAATHAACQQALPVAANGTGTLLSVDLQVLCALSAGPVQGGPHRQLLASWSEVAPANLRHKLDLVDATWAAGEGRLTEALLLFERARDGAAAAGFLRDQALAEQGCGEALALAGERLAAQRWLEDAWHTLLRWGALAAAEQLLARHPWLQTHESVADLEPPLRLEARVARCLDDFGAHRAVLRLVDPPTVLLAERADGALRVRLLAPHDLDPVLVPLRLLDQVARQGGALLLEQPGSDPAWQDEPCLAHRRPALAWAGRIGAGPSGGQAYLECDGPRLLMTARSRLLAQQHVDSIATALRAQAAEERLARSRHVDATTLLPNRAGFSTLVELTLAHTRGRSDLACVVYLVRPRGLAAHSPEFDEQTGTSPVLHELVLRLQQPARKGLAVARLEHRLFGMVFMSLPDRSAMLADARALLDRLEAPLLGGGRMLFELAACLDPGNISAADILSRSEHALASAGEGAAGIAVVEAADAATRHAEGGSVDLVRDLDWALRHSGLRLVYQPIVDMTDNRLIGAEALVRWHHPALGDIPPDRFVSLAERTGLIRYLGRWVTDAVIDQAARWREAQTGPKSLSFNASPLELLQPDYADYLIAALNRAGLAASDIVLEITESASLQDDDSTRANLAKLHDAGILMCIDDFGVGTSSLGRLHAVLARRLKIDRSFIEGVDRDAGRRTTVTMIIRLAESLSLDVVAEGVGRPEEVQFLLSEGLRLAQGYYYAKPLETEAMDRALSAGHV